MLMIKQTLLNTLQNLHFVLFHESVVLIVCPPSLGILVVLFNLA